MARILPKLGDWPASRRAGDAGPLLSESPGPRRTPPLPHTLAPSGRPCPAKLRPRPLVGNGARRRTARRSESWTPAGRDTEPGAGLGVARRLAGRGGRRTGRVEPGLTRLSNRDRGPPGPGAGLGARGTAAPAAAAPRRRSERPRAHTASQPPFRRRLAVNR